MKVGIFVTARMGSSRLKGKHFRQVLCEPIIKYLLGSICKEFESEIIKKDVYCLITTGNEIINKKFLSLKTSNVDIFFGDDQNIPLRHLKAASYYNLDAIISVDGDDIVCSTNAMRLVMEKLLQGRDLVHSVGLPFGMNVFGYSKNILQKALNLSSYGIMETGWGRIFENFTPFKISFDCPRAEEIRASLDYYDDLKFFKELIPILKKNSITDYNEIIRIIIENNLFKINSHLMIPYWESFYREKKSEVDNEKQIV